MCVCVCDMCCDSLPQSVEILGEEEDGWWRGQVGDRVGLFPSNFVEVLPEETSPLRETPAPAAPPSHDTSDSGPPQIPSSDRREFIECRVGTITSRSPPSTPGVNPPPVGGVPLGAGMLPRFNPADVKLKKTVVSLALYCAVDTATQCALPLPLPSSHHH